MESAFEIFGEIGAFIILLITMFSLYGKVVRDYSRFKTSTEKDISKIRKDIEDNKKFHDEEIAGLYLQLESIQFERVKDYKEIMGKIVKIEVDFVKANAKQTETLTKQIDENFKLLLKEIKK